MTTDISTPRLAYSSRLEWEVFYNDKYTAYCADGHGFVCLHAYKTRFGLLDQGAAVARLPRGDLAASLEIAQQYLAATYPGIFQQWDIQE